MLLGVLTLCAVNILSAITGVYIPVTRLTLLVGTVGGVPGVALMVLLAGM